MLPSFCKCIWFIGVHIFLQFWGWDNCCDEKCTLHILYSKAAFSFTPLTISLDRNTSILELWNWSLTKSFALYFEAMHQGSRHPRIQDVPLDRWSISLLDRESDPRTLRSFASYSDTLRSLYSDAAVAAPGTACTRHPALPLLWLSRPLYFWRLGLPFERDVPRLFLVVLFLWYKYIDVNVALLGKGGSEPRKEAAKALTAASHDINIILFWLELLLQVWLPDCTGWQLSANANVRYMVVANVRYMGVANVCLENVSQY